MADAPIASLILAAGSATRFRAGDPQAATKAVALLDGAPLVRHVAQAALGAGLGPVIVVTGFGADDVAKALGVSPATIRNDMAVLEEEGLIAQPHTSAGRVPTDQGYRVFVDRLSQVKPLSAAERRAIGSFLDGAVDLDAPGDFPAELLLRLVGDTHPFGAGLLPEAGHPAGRAGLARLLLALLLRLLDGEPAHDGDLLAVDDHGRVVVEPAVGESAGEPAVGVGGVGMSGLLPVMLHELHNYIITRKRQRFRSPRTDRRAPVRLFDHVAPSTRRVYVGQKSG